MAKGMGPAEMWLFVAGVYIGVPLLPILLLGPVGRSWPRLRNRSYDLLFAIGMGLIALQSLRRIESLSPGVAIALAAGLGGIFPWIYASKVWVRQLLTYLAFLSIAIPALFVLTLRSLLFVQPAQKVLPNTESMMVQRPAPVIVLIFDELPVSSLMNADGDIDSNLFPQFARLAATSTWYRRATTIWYETVGSLQSLLTGSYPSDDLLPSTDQRRQNLFTLFDETYRFVVDEPVTDLLPRDRDHGRSTLDTSRWRKLAQDVSIIYGHLVLPPTLAHLHLPAIGGSWEHFAEPSDKAADFRRFLDRIDSNATRQLVFLHSLLPHHPFSYLPSGRRYDTGSEIFIDGLKSDALGAFVSRWETHEWSVIQSYQRHLLQLSFTDRLLGRFLDRIDEVGLLDRAILVVTADHGIHFEPGAEARAADLRSLENLVSVPLFLKLPSQSESRISDRDFRSIDLLPTLIDVLGIECEWQMDGISQIEPRPSTDRPGHVYPSLTSTAYLVSEDRNVVASTTKAKQMLFGSPRSTRDLFHIGPFADRLIGKRTGDFELREGLGISVELEPFVPSNREGGTISEVRARFAGQLQGTSKEIGELPIALAFDGVIVATSLTREKSAESLYFSFLIPEEVAERARSELEIFALRPNGGSIALEKVSLAADRTYSLEADDAIETITSSDGSVFIHDPEHFRGELALLDPIRPIHRAELFGWVSDLAGSLPTAILVFRDGRFLAATSPRLRSKARMERYLLGEHSEAGFSLSLPVSEVKGALRIFALSETHRFTELELRNRVRPTEDFIGPYSLDGSSSAIH